MWTSERACWDDFSCMGDYMIVFNHIYCFLKLKLHVCYYDICIIKIYFEFIFFG